MLCLVPPPICMFTGREGQGEHSGIQVPMQLDLMQERNFLTYLAGWAWPSAGSWCLLNLG